MHQYNGYNVFSEGGGLRVSKIIDKSDSLSAEIIKTYKYGQNELGKGFYTVEPSPQTFVYEHYNLDYLSVCCLGSCNRYRERIISQVSQVMPFFMFMPEVWYDQVTEYSNDGKTIYKFDYQPDQIEPFYNQCVLGNGNASQDFPNLFIDNYNNVFQDGPRLINKSIYKKITGGYQCIMEESYEYEPTYGWNDCIRGIDIVTNVYIDGGHYSPLDSHNMVPYVSCCPYSYHIHSINSLIYLHSATNTKYYFDNGQESNQNVSYTYDQTLINLSSESSINSDGKQRTVNYYYPMDNLSYLSSEQKQYIPTLIQKNRLKIPIVQKTTFNGSTETIVTQYKDWGNNLLLPEKLYLQTGNGIQENRITYSNYDSHGNPLYLIKDAADNIVYLWSYNYQYPIAEIKNATFAEAEAAAKSVFAVPNIDSLSAKTTPDEAKLKDGSLQRALPDAQVSTYTYKPLVGMTSATAPNGVTTNYSYDAFGRLAVTRNMDNNILASYRYAYKSGTEASVIEDPEPLDLPFQAFILLDYSGNVKVTASVQITGGSGDYTISWQLKNESGTIVQLYDGPSFSFKAPASGVLTLHCTVTDNIKNIITTVSRKVIIPILLEDSIW